MIHTKSYSTILDCPGCQATEVVYGPPPVVAPQCAVCGMQLDMTTTEFYEIEDESEEE